MSTTDAFTPMPDTWHPSITEHTAHMVMERTLWPPSKDGNPTPLPRPVELLESRLSPRWLDDLESVSPDELVPTRTLLFTIRRCMAPAPFIGDPQRIDIRYTWLVAQDDYGRWIAGPVNLAWREIVAGAPA
jgi:hypothetical protein